MARTLIVLLVVFLAGCTSPEKRWEVTAKVFIENQVDPLTKTSSSLEWKVFSK